MIRVVIYLVIVGVLAFGAVWFADRPGDVAITWQGWRIETSVMVLMVAVAGIAALAVMLWSIVRAILRSPDILWLYLRTRRGVRGYLAVSQGLIAVGSGDVRAPRANSPTRPTASRRTSRSRCCSARRPRSSPATATAAERTFHADGEPRRHAAARPARPVHRGAAARRPGGRAALCRGGGEARAGAGLGRAGGAGIPLRRRRLDRRAGTARTQHEERADRQGVLPAPARRAADRARARRRGERPRRAKALASRSKR